MQITSSSQKNSSNTSTSTWRSTASRAISLGTAGTDTPLTGVRQEDIDAVSTLLGDTHHCEEVTVFTGASLWYMARTLRNRGNTHLRECADKYALDAALGMDITVPAYHRKSMGRQIAAYILDGPGRPLVSSMSSITRSDPAFFDRVASLCAPLLLVSRLWSREVTELSARTSLLASLRSLTARSRVTP
jgi:hypothetical protein